MFRHFVNRWNRKKNQIEVFEEKFFFRYTAYRRDSSSSLLFDRSNWFCSMKFVRYFLFQLILPMILHPLENYWPNRKFVVYELSCRLNSRCLKKTKQRQRTKVCLLLPSNWYWIKLLNASRRKKTKWWWSGVARRNQGEVNAWKTQHFVSISIKFVFFTSNKWTNLLLETIDKLFKYGEIFTIIVNKQSYRGWSRWWAETIILWKTSTKRKKKLRVETKRKFLQWSEDRRVCR